MEVSFLCRVFLILNNKAKNELPIDDEETLEKNKWDTLTMRWGITAVHHKAEIYSPNLRLPSVTQNKGALFAIFDQSIVVVEYILQPTYVGSSSSSCIGNQNEPFYLLRSIAYAKCVEI